MIRMVAIGGIWRKYEDGALIHGSFPSPCVICWYHVQYVTPGGMIVITMMMMMVVEIVEVGAVAVGVAGVVAEVVVMVMVMVIAVGVAM